MLFQESWDIDINANFLLIGKLLFTVFHSRLYSLWKRKAKHVSDKINCTASMHSNSIYLHSVQMAECIHTLLYKAINNIHRRYQICTHFMKYVQSCSLQWRFCRHALGNWNEVGCAFSCPQSALWIKLVCGFSSCCYNFYKKQILCGLFKIF